MRKYRLRLLIILLLVLLLTVYYFVGIPGMRFTQQGEPQLSAESTSVEPPQGYPRVTGPQVLSFPADHSAHPEYLTEWWYYTGNLESNNGRRFGYQFTLFRRAISPPGSRKERPSDWATDQVYLAHLAVSDIARKDYHAFERSARGSAGLAGAESLPYKIWLYDWTIVQAGENQYQLSAVEDDIRIDLILEDEKGLIFQGEDGYSQKGPHPGNASMYVSFSRLRTTGKIHIGEETFQVTGDSWMDHEFSTSALSSGQVGWDWFAIQLDNNTELMVYTIRSEDGTIDPFSSGTFIDQNGSTVGLDHDDFSITVLDSWKSPHSQAIYPGKWQVEVGSLDLDLIIEPLLPDQELNLTYIYWEGAVSIRGVLAGDEVSGYGYVELTGYKGPIAGDF